MQFPLVVGPYTGEMSYEFLTWIPYLRLRFGDEMKGIVAISRGGTQRCYPCSVINAHDVMGAAEMRRAMINRKLTTGRYKALPDDVLDNEILRRLGLQTTIHPSIASAIPFPYLVDYIRKIPKPPKPPALPDRYVAVRFFNNDWLDELPPREALKEYAGDLPLVFCESYEDTDNHAPLTPTYAHSKYSFPPFASIENMIAAFANAEMVFAPAGGVSYLSMLCGVKTIAFSNASNEFEYNSHYDDKLKEFASLTRHRF